jgi:hypothetical protein
MKRSIVFLTSALAVMCLILSATAPALAADGARFEIRTGSSNIALNDYAVISEFQTGQSLLVTPTLNYTVFTIGDSGILHYDILLMDESNFTKYKNHETFTYINAGSRIGVTAESISVSLALTPNKHYILVADNTDLPLGGSIPTQALHIGYVMAGYDVSFQSPTGNPIVLVLIAIIVVVVIIVVVFVLFLMMRKKKGIQQATAPPQYPPQPAISPATQAGTCPVCGTPVSPDFMACPNCGNRLK